MEPVLKHQFQHLTRQIKAADSVPALLASAFFGLDLIERATTALPDTGNDPIRPDYEAAAIEATDAWWALTQAPTLDWPITKPITADEARYLADTIAAFVLVVTEAMLTAASKSPDPADRMACLRAAHHAGRLHSALK
ncbi:hypothetical protein [Actinomadura nitritigenes]|uniref:hypothetical protein n=1 Tax=Actinomadura nitritigenes TaxID=134602 RepID=UPI003D934BCA